MERRKEGGGQPDNAAEVTSSLKFCILAYSGFQVQNTFSVENLSGGGNLGSLEDGCDMA